MLGLPEPHTAPNRHDLRQQDRRALRIALSITVVFLIVEVVGGWLSGSLALLADAGHLATDFAALALALFALRLADRPPTAAKTFGYQRTEILAALTNGVVLVLVSVYVVVEALGRLADPSPVRGQLMLGVAVAGLAANLAAAAVLFRGRTHSLNLRGAFLHVVGDTLGSIGAILAALAIQFGGWVIVDPLVAIGIAGLILVSAWTLVRESVDVLMEATPRHVDLAALDRAIRSAPGVLDVHDLHVWTLTSGYHAMSAHVDVAEGVDGHAVLHTLSDLASRRFDIAHTTFQLEPAQPLLKIER
jgi:cobalt-zinc-cadmium efflux system protein